MSTSPTQTQTIPADRLCSLTGLTDRRHRQLAKEGFFPPPVAGEYELAATIKGLFRFFREAGQHKDELRIQQARKEKQLADKLTRQNAIARGELCRWEDVLRILNEKICVPWRLALDGAPEEAREWRDKCLLPILRESLEPPKSP